jgi:hypothetical protein
MIYYRLVGMYTRIGAAKFVPDARVEDLWALSDRLVGD